jgi:predicted GTPase
MGYGQAQVEELASTINAVPCDVILLGTPVDLRRVLAVRHPVRRVRYEIEHAGGPTFEEVLAGL